VLRLLRPCAGAGRGAGLETPGAIHSRLVAPCEAVEIGPAIRKVCAQSVAVCREIGLLTKASVAIDGSKFKAVNNRDKNFTRAKMERRLAQIEESVARYLSQLDTADLQDPTEALAAKTAHLKEKLAKLATEMQRLKAIEKEMLASPDQQISLTDPDSRSMATSGRGSGVVGYNVQVAVDTEHHLIVTHEVTNTGSDRSQLAKVASQAKDILGADHLDAVADRGYFNSPEILACEPRPCDRRRDQRRARRRRLQFPPAPRMAGAFVVRDLAHPLRNKSIT
jgi:Transposase DDE domain